MANGSGMELILGQGGVSAPVKRDSREYAGGVAFPRGTETPEDQNIVDKLKLRIVQYLEAAVSRETEYSGALPIPDSLVEAFVMEFEQARDEAGLADITADQVVALTRYVFRVTPNDRIAASMAAMGMLGEGRPDVMTDLYREFAEQIEGVTNAIDGFLDESGVVGELMEMVDFDAAWKTWSSSIGMSAPAFSQFQSQGYKDRAKKAWEKTAGTGDETNALEFLIRNFTDMVTIDTGLIMEYEREGVEATLIRRMNEAEKWPKGLPSTEFMNVVRRQAERFMVFEAAQKALGLTDSETRDALLTEMDLIIDEFPSEEEIQRGKETADDTFRRVVLGTGDYGVEEVDRALSGDIQTDRDFMLQKAFNAANANVRAARAREEEDVSLDGAIELEIAKFPSEEEIRIQREARFGTSPPGVEFIGKEVTPDQAAALRAIGAFTGAKDLGAARGIDVVAGSALLDLERREREGARAFLADIDTDPTATDVMSLAEAGQMLRSSFGSDNDLYAKYVAPKKGRPDIGIEDFPSSQRESASKSTMFAGQALNASIKEQQRQQKARLKEQAKLVADSQRTRPRPRPAVTIPRLR